MCGLWEWALTLGESLSKDMYLVFPALSLQGGYSRGQMVKGDAVSMALSAISKEIALVGNIKPNKQTGSNKLLPMLAQILDG